MYIQLLTVTCGSLEANALWASVDQDGTVNLSRVLPLRKYIQKPVECVSKGLYDLM